MPKTALRCAAASLCALAAVAAIIGSDSGASISAQSDEQNGHIVARRLDDGRTEFGWQTAGGKRVLPTKRYFPANVDHGRWLRSSSVEVDGKTIGRINARLADDGRIEFAFTPTGGERILPSLRYFPTDALVGRWLRSTEITWNVAPRFTAVSAGDEHTCGLRESGAVECWGDNLADQLNAPDGRFSAISVGGVGFPPGVRTNVISTATCGLRDSGVIQCWGRTIYGDIPTGRFSAVSAGGYHICGLREGGSVECWGSNDYGQTDAPGGRFSTISAGWLHTCGLRESGTIVCWGQDLERIRHDLPFDRGQAIAPDGRFSAVSAGDFHTCGLREDGSVECWGDNFSGQADAPEGRFTVVSAGGAHTCGLRESGAVECWGADSPRGRSLRDAADYGQADHPDGRFSAVSAGWTHTCGLREGGSIECWGDNRRGQSDAPAP